MTYINSNMTDEEVLLAVGHLPADRATALLSRYAELFSWAERVIDLGRPPEPPTQGSHDFFKEYDQYLLEYDQWGSRLEQLREEF